MFTLATKNIYSHLRAASAKSKCETENEKWQKAGSESKLIEEIVCDAVA